jgi:hypothetical protein
MSATKRLYEDYQEEENLKEKLYEYAIQSIIDGEQGDADNTENSNEPIF